jgi:hypothetical protein
MTIGRLPSTNAASVSALAIFHSLTPFQLSGMYAGLFSS